MSAAVVCCSFGARAPPALEASQQCGIASITSASMSVVVRHASVAVGARRVRVRTLGAAWRSGGAAAAIRGVAGHFLVVRLRL